MGHPTFVPGLAQDLDSGTKGGIFPRLDEASRGSTATVTQTFWDHVDKFCDSGLSIATHLSHLNNFGVQATQFILQQVNIAVNRAASVEAMLLRVREVVFVIRLTNHACFETN